MVCFVKLYIARVRVSGVNSMSQAVTISPPHKKKHYETRGRNQQRVLLDEIVKS